MPHKLLFLDFETYYDTEYSLSKMAPPNYILDPRYETIGCGVIENDGAPYWVDGPDFPAFIAAQDAANTTTVTFNALFDNCILAWRYGFLPARMLCALRMSVALLGHKLPDARLKTVARYLNLGEKGTTIESVRGMRRSEIMNSPGLWRAFQAYACHDATLCRDIFLKLLPSFPQSERRVMDRVIRCAVDPQFMIDRNMLAAHMEDLANDKVRMLRLAAGEDPDNDSGELALGDESAREQALLKFAGTLRSNEKFSAMLQARGIEIGMKPSATDPTRLIPAFAKTDDFMAELQASDDPIVQALAAARLGVRSTIEESRGQRILSIAELDWSGYRGGNMLMPFPLRYSGAHTHRLSGDWKLNMQNLPSGRGTKKSKLRKALIAPPGHEVVVADLAQIECRIAAFLCSQQDLLSQFANGEDPYSILASRIFNMQVDKNVHKTERFIGKSGVLGLGFGCGATKFYNMVIRTARSLGMDVPKLLEVWTPALAQKSVDTYRALNRGITSTWRRLDHILDTAWCGATGPIRFGPVIIGHGYVEGPTGLRMLYDVLPKDDEGHSFRYAGKVHRMYGAKFLENIVQFLARIVIMNAALRLWDRGLQFRLQAHDELGFIVPTEKVAQAKKIVHEEMVRRPSWAPTLPLAAEVGSGPSYGDAK